MTLEQTRLVTGDVATLTRFYEGVSQGKAAIINSGYVEFHSEPCGGLAIVGPADIQAYRTGVVEPGAADIGAALRLFVTEYAVRGACDD